MFDSVFKALGFVANLPGVKSKIESKASDLFTKYVGDFGSDSSNLSKDLNDLASGVDLSSASPEIKEAIQMGMIHGRDGANSSYLHYTGKARDAYVLYYNKFYIARG